jgi:hypothetical protein
MSVNISDCNDQWCEDYGKGNEKCDRCKKKNVVKDKPVLQVILKRRADKQMELDKNVNRIRGQER